MAFGETLYPSDDGEALLICRESDGQPGGFTGCQEHVDASGQAQIVPDDFLKRGEVEAMDEKDDNRIYKVVVNHEEQYSIWPADKINALGWEDAGKVGTKTECLAHIKEVWVDMRPLSLRKKMEEAKQQSAAR